MSGPGGTGGCFTGRRVVYRGYGPGSRSSGGRLVVVEVDGEVVGPLPHRVKHSPTGMTWGYSGSGPADLARSLLIHALGRDAACAACDGTGDVVYDVVVDREIAACGAEAVEVDIAGELQPRYSEPMSCRSCDSGCTVRPSVYQQYKFAVVARLPEADWILDRDEILDWVAAHRHLTKTEPR